MSRRLGNDGYQDIALTPGMDNELVLLLCRAGWRAWRTDPRGPNDKIFFSLYGQKYMVSREQGGIAVWSPPATKLCLRLL